MRVIELYHRRPQRNPVHDDLVHSDLIHLDALVDADANAVDGGASFDRAMAGASAIVPVRADDERPMGLVWIDRFLEIVDRQLAIVIEMTARGEADFGRKKHQRTRLEQLASFMTWLRDREADGSADASRSDTFEMQQSAVWREFTAARRHDRTDLVYAMTQWVDEVAGPPRPERRRRPAEALPLL